MKLNASILFCCAAIVLLAGCGVTPLTRSTQDEPVVTVSPCYDVRRDLTLPWQGQNTAYYCGTHGVGALYTTPVYIGSDTKQYPSPDTAQ